MPLDRSELSRPRMASVYAASGTDSVWVVEETSGAPDPEEWCFNGPEARRDALEFAFRTFSRVRWFSG